MSIDISCALIVGLSHDELEEWLDENEYELERISPSYDCPNRYCLYGITLYEGENSSEIDPTELIEKIKQAKEEFLEFTGLEGRLYLSPHVY